MSIFVLGRVLYLLLSPQRCSPSGTKCGLASSVLGSLRLTFELLVPFEPPDGSGWLAGHGGAVDFNLLAFHRSVFLDIDHQITRWDYKLNTSFLNTESISGHILLFIRN